MDPRCSTCLQQAQGLALVPQTGHPAHRHRQMLVLVLVPGLALVLAPVLGLRA